MYIDELNTLSEYPAGIYERKSNEAEDRQIASLEDQRTANIKSIEIHNITVAKKHFFTESMSARYPGRPEFKKMLDLIEEGKIQIVVTWHANRLARNGTDAGALIQLLSDGKLKAIVTPHKMFFNNGADVFMLYVDFGQSDKYSKDLSVDVKRGMYSKIKRGWWASRPKLGYINLKIGNQEPIQVIDEERFPLLRRAVELYLEGNTSVENVIKKLNDEWGFRTRKTAKRGGTRLAKSRFYDLLKDPYYYGKMQWGDEEAEMHPDLPRLMTEEEFWRVQELLGNKGKKRPQKHRDLAFRGLIKCGECGSTWIPYKRRKKLKNGDVREYEYFRCNYDSTRQQCSQKQTTIEDIEKQTMELLDSVTISDDFCNWAIKWIKEQHGHEQQSQQQVLENLEYRLGDNQNKLNRLLDLQIDGLISKEDYANKKEELKAQRENIERELKSLNNRTFDWMELAEKAFTFANNAKTKFENGTAEEKTLILKTLGSNFFMDTGNISLEMDKPFVVFKENQEVVNFSFETIEPGLTVEMAAQSGAFDDWFSKWSG